MTSKECPDAWGHGNPMRYCYCGWMEEAAPPPPSFHATVATKDLNTGVRYASRLALDRARQGGFNPRQGTLTLTFTDHEVTAKWEKK